MLKPSVIFLYTFSLYFSFGCEQVSPKAEVVCYSDGILPISQIDPCKCSILVIKTLTISKDFLVESNIDLTSLHNLKRKNTFLKLVISLGGREVPAYTFSSIASNVEGLTNFTEGLASYVAKHQLDGVEIDWRWPGKHPDDKEDLTTLMKVLRHALKDKVLRKISKRQIKFEYDEPRSLVDAFDRTYEELSVLTLEKLMNLTTSQLTTEQPNESNFQWVLTTPSGSYENNISPLPTADITPATTTLLESYENIDSAAYEFEENDGIPLKEGSDYLLLEDFFITSTEEPVEESTTMKEEKTLRGLAMSEISSKEPSKQSLKKRGSTKFKDYYKPKGISKFRKQHPKGGGWKLIGKTHLEPIEKIITPLEKRIGSSKIVMLTIAPIPKYIVEGYNLKELQSVVDLFSVPSHNFSVENDQMGTVAYHHSRLMGVSDIENTDSLLDLIVSMGIPLDRLVMGVPTTGAMFRLKDASQTIPRSPVHQAPTWITYSQVCSLLDSGNWSEERDADLTAPYAYRNETWLSFDDTISLRIKSKYAILRGLAGIGLHSLDNDDWDGICSKGKFPLLNSIFQTFTQLNRTPRKAIVRSLVKDLQNAGTLLRQNKSSQSRSMNDPSFRIVRVVDRSGAITAIRSDTTTKYECSRQGFYRDPEDCSQFYRCVKFNQYIGEYTVFEYSCPDGLVFDDRWEICSWPSAATPCDGSSEIFPVPRRENVCSQEGYFTDPENCRWFYACRDYHGNNTFTVYEFRCPFGLAYDEENQICNWPWLVSSCGDHQSTADDKTLGKSFSLPERQLNLEVTARSPYEKSGTSFTSRESSLNSKVQGIVQESPDFHNNDPRPPFTTGSEGKAFTSTGSEGKAFTSTGSEGKAFTSTGSEGKAFTSTGSEGKAFTSIGSERRAFTSTGSEGKAFTSTEKQTQKPVEHSSDDDNAKKVGSGTRQGGKSFILTDKLVTFQEQSAIKECTDCNGAEITIKGNGIYHPEKGIIVSPQYFENLEKAISQQAPTKGPITNLSRSSNTASGKSSVGSSLSENINQPPRSNIEFVPEEVDRNSNLPIDNIPFIQQGHHHMKSHALFVSSGNSGSSAQKVNNKLHLNDERSSSVEAIPSRNIGQNQEFSTPTKAKSVHTDHSHQILQSSNGKVTNIPSSLPTVGNSNFGRDFQSNSPEHFNQNLDHFGTPKSTAFNPHNDPLRQDDKQLSRAEVSHQGISTPTDLPLKMRPNKNEERNRNKSTKQTESFENHDEMPLEIVRHRPMNLQSNAKNNNIVRTKDNEDDFKTPGAGNSAISDNNSKFSEDRVTGFHSSGIHGGNSPSATVDRGNHFRSTAEDGRTHLPNTGGNLNAQRKQIRPIILEGIQIKGMVSGQLQSTSSRDNRHQMDTPNRSNKLIQGQVSTKIIPNGGGHFVNSNVDTSNSGDDTVKFDDNFAFSINFSGQLGNVKKSGQVNRSKHLGEIKKKNLPVKPTPWTNNSRLDQSDSIQTLPFGANNSQHSQIQKNIYSQTVRTSPDSVQIPIGIQQGNHFGEIEKENNNWLGAKSFSGDNSQSRKAKNLSDKRVQSFEENSNSHFKISSGKESSKRFGTVVTSASSQAGLEQPDKPQSDSVESQSKFLDDAIASDWPPQVTSHSTNLRTDKSHKSNTKQASAHETTPGIIESQNNKALSSPSSTLAKSTTWSHTQIPKSDKSPVSNFVKALTEKVREQFGSAVGTLFEKPIKFEGKDAQKETAEAQGKFNPHKDFRAKTIIARGHLDSDREAAIGNTKETKEVSGNSNKDKSNLNLNLDKSRKSNPIKLGDKFGNGKITATANQHSDSNSSINSKSGSNISSSNGSNIRSSNASSKSGSNISSSNGRNSNSFNRNNHIANDNNSNISVVSSNSNVNQNNLRKSVNGKSSLLAKFGIRRKFQRFGPGGFRDFDDTLGPEVCERVGLFRHPDSCDKFYECYWDQWIEKYTLHVFDCPVTIIYDSGITACNWPFNGPSCADRKHS